MIKTSLIKTWLCAAFVAAGCLAGSAQTQTVQALFEYPVAPEELTDIRDKSNYLMENFWKPLDMRLSPVNQAALNHAFQVYCTPLRFADKDVALASVSNLLEQLKGNPTLLLQFVKAAEYNLYGPQAQFWSDDVYGMFLEAASKNKKLKSDRRKRYSEQLAQLRSSQPGQELPRFSATMPDGSTKKFAPQPGLPTLLIVSDPTNPDESMGRLSLELNTPLNTALSEGKVAVWFISKETDPKWERLTTGLPPQWQRAASSDVASLLDLRTIPSIYVLDASGAISGKNLLPDEAVRMLLSQTAN